MAKQVKSKYAPHPKQALFHIINARFKLFLAGIGTGKTLAGVHEILRLSQINPGYDGLISAPTYPMIRDVILPQWYEYIPDQLFQYYKKDQMFELWTGQRLFLRSFERPDAIRGLNLGYAWADELAMVQSQESWDILLGRVGRTKDVPNPCIFATTTPRGWNWLARKFLKSDNPDFITVRARSSDNPYFSPELLRTLREEYGEEFARQELDAEIVESAGKVLDINPKIHHNFTLRELAEYRGRKKVVAGVDWGYSAPFAIAVWVKLEKINTWHFVEEFYKPNLLASDMYAAMRDIKNRWKVARFYCDSAEPERVASAITAGLPAVPVKKGPDSIKRGITELRSLLAVRGRTGKPGLYINESNRHFVEECDNFHYKEPGSEIVVAEKGDHLIDACRYIAMEESRGSSIQGLAIHG
jgi:hypothetical protein